MPTYEYSCPIDGETASVERSMIDDEVVPTCRICQTDMKRVYYAAPVKFNGTGFYSTGG